MELRDARLGDAEHLADLAEGQLLVVVERDDELLALGQAGDRVGERLRISVCESVALRVGRLGVLDRVDQGDLVAVRAGDRPELVERGDRRAGDLGEAVLELLDGDPDLRPRSPRRSARVPSFASSSAIARSISRARERTERGTQSSARSSSMIAPLIRAIAYVSNLTSRSGS